MIKCDLQCIHDTTDNYWYGSVKIRGTDNWEYLGKNFCDGVLVERMKNHLEPTHKIKTITYDGE